MRRCDPVCSLGTAMLALASASLPSIALEPGQAPQTKPGIAIGVTAIPLPAAMYFVNHNFYYDYRLTGAGVAAVPNPPRGGAKVVDVGLLWVPGWTFLGATYSAYVALQYVGQSINSAPSAGFPGVSYQGVHNAFIGPLRLQWDLGRGFYAQAGIGVYVPTGTITGPLGNSNTGADYFTFQPNLAFTYLTGNWSFTAYSYYEHNTRNARSGYRTGDIVHVDLTAMGQFGNWTVGPVAYYVRQTTSDRPSATTDAALTAALLGLPINGFNAGKFESFAVGGLVSYNFGKLFLTVIATTEVSARTFGGYSGTPALSSIPFTNETTTRGWTVLSRLTYPLWLGPTPP
jgi:hypothetical protein